MTRFDQEVELVKQKLDTILLFLHAFLLQLVLFRVLLFMVSRHDDCSFEVLIHFVDLLHDVIKSLSLLRCAQIAFATYSLIGDLDLHICDKVNRNYSTIFEHRINLRKPLVLQSLRGALDVELGLEVSTLSDYAIF